MATTVLIIVIAILLVVVIKLTGVVFLLTGWLFKLLLILGLVLFLLYPRRAKRDERRGK